MAIRPTSWSGRGPRALAAFAVAALLLAGCSATGGSEAARSGLRVATPWQVTTLDPVSEGYWSMNLGYGEYLLRPMPSGIPQPWVAKSAEPVTQTEWRITLHRGVTFQNGEPADADAIAAMMNHQLAENPLLDPVLPGAVATSTGPTTVMLTTTSPVAHVPELLAHAEMFPVYDVEAVESVGENKQELVGACLVDTERAGVVRDTRRHLAPHDRDLSQLVDRIMMRAVHHEVELRIVDRHRAVDLSCQSVDDLLKLRTHGTSQPATPVGLRSGRFHIWEVAHPTACHLASW